MLEIDGVRYYKVKEIGTSSSMHMGLTNLNRPTKYVAKREKDDLLVFIKEGYSISQKMYLWREYQALLRASPSFSLRNYQFKWAHKNKRWFTYMLEYLSCIGPKIIRAPSAKEMSSQDFITYLVMEYFNDQVSENGYAWIGKSLLERVSAEGPFINNREWSLLANTLMRALKILHRRGVYHCDLTPGHIWISEDPFSLRLVDFGLSYVTHIGLDYLPGGTDLYTAPEVFPFQYQQSRLNVPGPSPSNLRLLDYFSLGACLYFAATGQHPPTESFLWSRLDNLKNPIERASSRKFKNWFETQIKLEAERAGLGAQAINAIVTGLNIIQDERKQLPECLKKIANIEDKESSS